MTGGEAVAARAIGEGEQLAETERAVAAHARVRRGAVRIPVDERRDDGVAELLAQVERHVRDAETMACLACGDHGLGRAARTLGVGPVGIEPEAKRHADRVRQRAQERDRAVDAAAHRHRRPARLRLGAEDRPERIGERVDRERLAGDRRGLEQRQAGERPVEPRCVRLDDAVAVDEEPNRSPLAVAGGVSECFHVHARTRYQTFAPCARCANGRYLVRENNRVGPDLGNLSKQVGALPPRRRTRAPFMVLLVHHSARTHHTPYRVKRHSTRWVPSTPSSSASFGVRFRPRPGGTSPRSMTFVSTVRSPKRTYRRTPHGSCW